MAKLTKTQEWLIVVLAGLLILVGVGVTYYFLTAEEKTATVEVIKTEVAGETDLADVDKELDELEEMDLGELDAIEKDLESIDLEGLE